MKVLPRLRSEAEIAVVKLKEAKDYLREILWEYDRRQCVIRRQILRRDFGICIFWH